MKRTAVKSIRIVIDRHLAHSWQNWAGGGGNNTDGCSSEVQHRDEKSDDVDARDDGNVADQSSGVVLAQVQPEGKHHSDNLDALVS